MTGRASRARRVTAVLGLGALAAGLLSGCAVWRRAPAPAPAARVVSAASLEELEAVGLTAGDRLSQGYVERLAAVIGDGDPEQVRWLVFATGRDPGHTIVDAEGRPLTDVIVSRAPVLEVGWEPSGEEFLGPDSDDAEFSTCARTFPVDLDEVRLGQSINANTGICGQMATVHSKVKLGKITAAAAFSGSGASKVFRRAALAAVGPLNKSLKNREIKAAHASSAPCRSSSARTSDTRRLAGIVNNLNVYLNLTTPAFDCLLDVYRFRPGSTTRFELAHVEYIDRLTVSGGVATISCINGLEQGNQSTTVPAAGTNVWTVDPAQMSGDLSSSTSAAVTSYFANRDLDIVGYICCPR